MTRTDSSDPNHMFGGGEGLSAQDDGTFLGSDPNSDSGADPDPFGTDTAITDSELVVADADPDSLILPQQGPQQQQQQPPPPPPPPPQQQLPATFPEYGPQWAWDDHRKDYIRQIGDKILLYTDYQRRGAKGLLSEPKPASSEVASPTEPPTSPGPNDLQLYQERAEEVTGNGDQNQADDLVSRFQRLKGPSIGLLPPPPPPPAQIPRPLPGSSKKPWEATLDERFRIVDKPRRFFSVGRIFKTVWFEPGGQDTPVRRQDLDWRRACPDFFGQKPYAKFRWYVVVRKRLHHSLCFSITTFGGRGATKPSRGRARDFVVLHSSQVEPPAPFEQEGIERAPIAVIIEDGEQFISPLARLDCGRIYTVEDNLKVMKIGRVHPDSLTALEEYFKEATV